MNVGYQVYICERSSLYTIWIGIEFGYVIGLVILCLIEGFKVRNTPVAFNESHFIFLCSVVFVIFTILVIPVQVSEFESR